MNNMCRSLNEVEGMGPLLEFKLIRGDGRLGNEWKGDNQTRSTEAEEETEREHRWNSPRHRPGVGGLCVLLHTQCSDPRKTDCIGRFDDITFCYFASVSSGSLATRSPVGLKQYCNLWPPLWLFIYNTVSLAVDSVYRRDNAPHRPSGSRLVQVNSAWRSPNAQYFAP